MLTRDAPEIVDESVGGFWHVQHLGITIDLHPRAVPLVREDHDGGVLIPGGIAGLAASRVSGDHYTALGVNTSGHGRHLRPAVRTRGCEEHPVTGSDEVENSVAVDRS